mmetsp:Transcript_12692/g.32547  ORF Transcript_12692/g.32547 Transcript_12692/m.32547 type:complete len:141 (+) Transcript_12692:171-593(+)|eukprot:jgi/Tetstr1/429293/TSEL_019211.t1
MVMSKTKSVKAKPVAKQDGNTQTWTLLCLAAVVGGMVWCTRRLGRSNGEQDKAKAKPTPSTRSSGQPRTVGKGKKKSKSDKAAEKQRRAEKRDKHLEQEPGPRSKEEDDGNNELYVNYTFHTGGRSDRATDAFGGKAVVK